MDSLGEVYQSIKVESLRQDYQLFNIEKRRVNSRANSPGITALDDYMLKKHNLVSNTHYFLKYSKHSFTRIHADNKDVVKKTIITFIDSHNLVGGNTIVYDKHYDLPPNKDQNMRRTGSSHHKNVVPCVLPDIVGSSLIYDWSTPHGVSKVYDGHRIVLVSWYVEVP